MKFEILLFAMIMFFVCTVNASVQNDEPPIGKQSMLDNLKMAKKIQQNSVSDHKRYLSKLITVIKVRGVNFVMSPDDERQFLSAGADLRVLTAIKKNYRKPTNPTPTLTPAPTPTPTPTPLPCKLSQDGAPISFSDLEDCLRRRQKYSEIELAIYKRKVDFILDDNTRSIIIKAGAPISLIKAIDESPSPTLLSRLAIYNCDQAEILLNELKFNEARTLLEYASKYDPSNSNVYRLRAELNLYQNNQIDVAFLDMIQAIKMGGDASVKVMYDCGGKLTCPGKLFISNSRVLFRPDNGNEWTISISEVQEVKAGGDRYKRQNAGFIIVTKNTRANRSMKYNFQAHQSMNILRDKIELLIKLTLNK